jgi:hypothetical protein
LAPRKREVFVDGEGCGERHADHYKKAASYEIEGILSEFCGAENCCLGKANVYGEISI